MIDYILFKLERDDLECRFKSCKWCALFVQRLIDKRLDSVEHGYQLCQAISSLSQDKGYDHESSIFIQNSLFDINLATLPIALHLCLDLAPGILKRLFKLW